MKSVKNNQHINQRVIMMIKGFKTYLLLSIFFLLFFGCEKVGMEELAPNRTVEQFTPMVKMASGMNEIDIMSFNIRRDNTSDPQSLDERKSIILQLIIDTDPDVVGVQELTDDWMETWLTDQMNLIGYDVFKTKTWAYSSPKAIYYKSNRFSLQDSKGFDLAVGDEHRSGHWVKLYDSVTHKSYFIANSHWSTVSSEVRADMANRLKDVVEDDAGGLPKVVFGDFNAQPGTNEISTIKGAAGGLVCAHNETGETFHGWDATGDHKIDWMLVSRDIAYIQSKVVTTSYGGYWPSDHWPILVSIVPAVFGGANYDVYGISASSNTTYYFADVTGDGKADKIYWNPTYDSGHTRVYKSNGDGTFTFLVSNPEGYSASSTTEYYFADITGDGKADKIKWNPAQDDGHTRVYVATGNGNFSSSAISNSEGYSTSSGTIYYFADVTGDGKADKIKWNPNQDNGHTCVYVATANGYFSSSAISNSEGYSTSSGTTYYFADVTGDGKADKIRWNPEQDNGHTRVYVATGNGYFSSSAVSSTNGYSGSANTTYYFTDVNGDGKADRIYWNPNAYKGKLKIFRSNGSSATFDDAIYTLRGTSQSSDTKFYFADIDGDGKDDQIRWNYTETPSGYSQGTLKNYLAN